MLLGNFTFGEDAFFGFNRAESSFVRFYSSSHFKIPYCSHLLVAHRPAPSTARAHVSAVISLPLQRGLGREEIETHAWSAIMSQKPLGDVELCK